MTHGAALPTSLLPAAPANSTPHAAPAPRTPPRRWPARRRHRCFYAIKATRHQISMPAATRLGYLTQSRLLQRAQAGDPDAHRLVWAANARLAYSVINRLRIRPDLMADAFQEAQLGLCRAIRRFEVQRLLGFSTYAFAAMRRFALRHRGRVGFGIRLPSNRVSAYHQFRDRVAEAPSRSQWFDAREEYLDRDPNEYRALLTLHGLAAPSGIEAARDQTAPILNPADAVLSEDAMQSLRESLPYLTQRQQFVLARRFGLWGWPSATLEQIGPSLGLTKERVRQIQNHALAALRDRLQARGWSELPPSLMR
jgi:RNA polymerase nonessential primary-like sigma factor